MAGKNRLLALFTWILMSLSIPAIAADAQPEPVRGSDTTPAAGAAGANPDDDEEEDDEDCGDDDHFGIGEITPPSST